MISSAILALAGVSPSRLLIAAAAAWRCATVVFLSIPGNTSGFCRFSYSTWQNPLILAKDGCGTASLLTSGAGGETCAGLSEQAVKEARARIKIVIYVFLILYNTPKTNVRKKNRAPARFVSYFLIESFFKSLFATTGTASVVMQMTG